MRALRAISVTAAWVAAAASCGGPPPPPPVTSRAFALPHEVERIAAAPDGERVLISCHTGRDINVLHTYTRATHQGSQVILKARVRALAMLSASTAVLAYEDGSLWELTLLPGGANDQRLLLPAGSPEPTALVAIDDHRVLLADTPWPPRPQGARLTLFDTKGAPRRELRASSAVPHWLDLAASGDVLFGLDGLRLWRCDLAADSVFSLQGELRDGDPAWLAPGPDGGVLLGGIEVREHRSTGEDSRVAYASEARVRQLCSTRDGRLVAWLDTANVPRAARRGGDGSWQPVALPGAPKNVRTMTLDPAGRYLVVGYKAEGYAVLEVPPPPPPPQAP